MHVYRPLFVILGLVALILTVRYFVVPQGFGVHANGYMYGWYRTSNIEDWKKMPVQHQGRDYCKDCHEKEVRLNLTSPHAKIQCENCHGPAGDHPNEPPRLSIDRSREQCLRCHSQLNYAQSDRSKIKGIDPLTHNVDIECASCHNPHQPNLEKMQ